ncbi:unnamed protein product [Cyprideis torosa]|uniref:Cystathionine beta-synthase n=1 Tax=Cyprideis torosa TaxID=163714 RepID=A0A7R8WII3_9CRUS|nr:unnamed protein product [Cyprideis torosa]CAG0897942.1 unnamed protein product [Cyprideis torosa]
MPLDLGASGSCHIGGNISTNAGGIRLIRYGNLHGNLLGVEAVLSNGDIFDGLSTIRKDNTGYDLGHLFVGSEGTLGIVTGVALQTASRPQATNVAFLAAETFDSCLAILRAAKTELGEVMSSCEFLDHESMRCVTENLSLTPPIGENPFYMLIETSGSNASHDQEKLDTFLENIMMKGDASDGTMADSPSTQQKLWGFRERMAEALLKDGYNYKYDISLPIESFYEAVEVMREKLTGMDDYVRCCGYGHIGDGNLHLNITSRGFTPILLNAIEPFVYDWTKSQKGSVSAEHGLGFKKKDFIYHSKSSMDFSKGFIAPDLPSKCRWTANSDPATTPHSIVDWKPRPKIFPSILETLGHTPLVRINHIHKDYGITCEVLVKCEYLNAGGSIKDRIAQRMVWDAEKDGVLKPGYTIIEPTSGNTGIGLALAAAVKGYRCIIVMPEKMSTEKVDVLRALGAEIVRTPTSAAFDAPESHISVAQRLMREIPNAVILDQYRNPGNPLAHYDCTAEEILDACGGKVDMVVVGAGTGGSVTGIGRKFKERCPDCIVVGVDPMGSILAEPEEMNETDVTFYEVEGVGYDFIPTVLDRSVVNRWIKTADKESLRMSRKLIRQEGLLVGGSSGANMVAAMDACKCLKAGQRCVVILPDGVRNYMTKFLSDAWMIERGFMEPDSTREKTWWETDSVGQLKLSAPLTIAPDMTCQEAVEIMRNKGFDQIPVMDEKKVVGILSLGGIVSKLSSTQIEKKTQVRDVMYSHFKKVTMDTPLTVLSSMLDRDHFVLVAQEQVHVSSQHKQGEKEEKIVGILTRIDLVNYITKGGSSQKSLNVYTAGSGVDGGPTPPRRGIWGGPRGEAEKSTFGAVDKE